MTWRSLIPSSFRSDSEIFKALTREMERSFSHLWKTSHLAAPLTFPTKEEILLPDIDVSEKDKSFQIMAELPGLEEKDIKVEFNNNYLTISGEKKLEREEKQNNYYIAECSSGFFNRTVQIPTAIDKDRCINILK